VGQLLKDIAEIRRARREIRAQWNARWDEEGVWRPHLWNRMMIWAGAVFGIYLLFWGDTVEQIIGVGLVFAPAVLLGIQVWVYWNAVRILRRERKGHTA
jgi:hypothetical protein